MAGGRFAAVVACDVCRWREDVWTEVVRVQDTGTLKALPYPKSKEDRIVE